MSEDLVANPSSITSWQYHLKKVTLLFWASLSLSATHGLKQSLLHRVNVKNEWDGTCETLSVIWGHQHMEVPDSEPYLWPTPPLQQHWILNPSCQAGDWTFFPGLQRCHRFALHHKRNSQDSFFYGNQFAPAGNPSLLDTPVFFFFSFCFFRATTTAYEGSQGRGWIGAGAAGLRHSHSNAKSKLHLQPTLPLATMLILKPLSEARDGTSILMGISWVLNPLSHNGNSGNPCILWSNA